MWDMLPLEMEENILSSVNGLDGLRLRLVSRRWNWLLTSRLPPHLTPQINICPTIPMNDCGGCEANVSIFMSVEATRSVGEFIRPVSVRRIIGERSELTRAQKLCLTVRHFEFCQLRVHDLKAIHVPTFPVVWSDRQSLAEGAQLLLFASTRKRVFIDGDFRCVSNKILCRIIGRSTRILVLDGGFWTDSMHLDSLIRFCRSLSTIKITSPQSITFKFFASHSTILDHLGFSNKSTPFTIEFNRKLRVQTERIERIRLNTMHGCGLIHILASNFKIPGSLRRRCQLTFLMNEYLARREYRLLATAAFLYQCRKEGLTFDADIALKLTHSLFNDELKESLLRLQSSINF